MTMFCPNCEAEQSVRPVRKVEDFLIRGVEIPIEVEYFICTVCGDEFDSPRGADPLVAAFEEYRRREGLIQPEEIREFRKTYGLTQHELAKLLGWGPTTLSRYENGALQDEAHDRALRMIMKPDNLLAQLQRAPTALSPEKHRAVTGQIRSKSSAASDQLDHIENWLTAYDPDERSGYQRFSTGKFFNAVLYFCREEMTKTKLNKLLWYADFLHFKRHARSITGARYAHCPHGPAPDKFETLFAYLRDYTSDLRTEVRVQREAAWEVFFATRAPDLGIFGDAELQTLLDINNRFKGYTAGRISDFSHHETGYQETKDGELISYEYAESLSVESSS